MKNQHTNRNGDKRRSTQAKARNNISRFPKKQSNQRMQEMNRPKKRMIEKSYFDYTFLFVLIFLVGFGLVMVYSASYYEAMQMYGDPTHYLTSQATAVAIGFAGMLVVYRVPYQWYLKLGWIPYVLCYLMVALIIPFGHTANGATRWIKFGPITFQAAEPIKLGIIIFLASYVHVHRKEVNSFKTFIRMLLLSMPICFLVLTVTDNLSSAIIIAAIAVCMIFVASKDYKKYVIIGLSGLSAAAAVVWYIVNSASTDGGFRSERILAWLDLESYASDTGFQTLQSLYAIGSGGIWGKGLGQSIQKLSFLPEAQNDMIFSIICEELGLFGGISVILMFIILIWRMVIIATHAPDIQGGMIVVGVIGHIAIQVILNIAVVTNTIPNTGISLPFISYGGTSACFLMVEMGLVMSVARSIKVRV